MREYSLNLLRWLKWFYLSYKYKDRWRSFYTPKPRTKRYLRNLCIHIEKEIFNHPYNYVPHQKEKEGEMDSENSN